MRYHCVNVIRAENRPKTATVVKFRDAAMQLSHSATTAKDGDADDARRKKQTNEPLRHASYQKSIPRN